MLLKQRQHQHILCTNLPAFINKFKEIITHSKWEDMYKNGGIFKLYTSSNNFRNMRTIWYSCSRLTRDTHIFARLYVCYALKDLNYAVIVFLTPPVRPSSSHFCCRRNDCLRLQSRFHIWTALYLKMKADKRLTIAFHAYFSFHFCYLLSLLYRKQKNWVCVFNTLATLYALHSIGDSNNQLCNEKIMY